MKHASQRDTLADKAARCLLCLEDPEALPLDRLRWQAWLAESPAHRAAYEACKALWSLEPSPGLVWPTREELARDPYRGDGPIPIGGFSATKPNRRFGTTGAVLAISAMVIAGATWLWPRTPKAEIRLVVTARAEQKQLRLADGSEILLGPESRLQMRYGPTERRFDLEGGEAIFTIAHDPARPVRVFAGSGWIEDIGTAFSVQNGKDGTTVAVIQGEVAVTSGAGKADPVKLEPNQELTYGAAPGPIRATDSALATGWSRGQFAYIDRPLGEVLADLRRYSLKDIVARDPAVEALRYTGTISVDHLDQWAAGLARVYPIRVESGDGRLILASAAGTK
ncbi:MAG TPA: FecR domain-containing protein [Alphaproteobacteria bacterium]|nr:FecR domain-containing protein [Alphaproteobacteria bacterium]